MSTKGNPGGRRPPPAPNKGPGAKESAKPAQPAAQKPKPDPKPESRPASGGAAPAKRRSVGVEGETPQAAIERKRIQPRSLKDILGDENAPPNPEAEEAKKKGAKAWHPERVNQFMRGQITLGDLEGITKQEQYEMAKIGYSYLTSGKLDKAKVVFEGLLALDPFDAYFHTALGSIAQQTEQLEEAEARYTRALEINPFSPIARAHRGEIRVMTGRITEGAEDLLRALQEDPGGREPSTIRARATLQAVKEQLMAANAGLAAKAKEVTGSKVAVHKSSPSAPAAPGKAPPRPQPRASRPGPRPGPGPKKK